MNRHLAIAFLLCLQWICSSGQPDQMPASDEISESDDIPSLDDTPAPEIHGLELVFAWPTTKLTILRDYWTYEKFSPGYAKVLRQIEFNFRDWEKMPRFVLHGLFAYRKEQHGFFWVNNEFKGCNDHLDLEVFQYSTSSETRSIRNKRIDEIMGMNRLKEVWTSMFFSKPENFYRHQWVMFFLYYKILIYHDTIELKLKDLYVV